MSQFDTPKISKARYLSDEEVNNININNNERNDNENKNNDIKFLPPKDLGTVTNQGKYLSTDQLKDINNYCDTKSGEIIQSKKNHTEEQWKLYFPSGQLGETLYNTNYIENNVNSINNNISNVGNAKNDISNIFGDNNVVSTINIDNANNNYINIDILGNNNLASTINNLIGSNILGNNEFIKMSKTQYAREDSNINILF